MKIQIVGVVLVLLLISGCVVDKRDLSDMSQTVKATQDIHTAPELGTAVSGDSLLAVDNDDAAGSRLSRIIFDGDVTKALSGIGTWVPVGGGVEGTSVLSTGETGAVKYLREDGDGTSSWQVPAGSGDVSKVGTTADSQIGIWTGDGTIEGASSATYDGSNMQFTGDLGSTGTRITKGWFTDFQVTNTIVGSVTGTSMALAIDPANCSAGYYPAGIAVSGDVEGCTDATTEIDSAIGTHSGAADPHTVYMLESEMGTASIRDAEDTLTDGANLPDGAAVKAYGDTNWGGGSMTWPSVAGIPYWTTGTAWGGAYTLVTTIGDPGSDTNIPSAQAVRELVANADNITTGSLSVDVVLADEAPTTNSGHLTYNATTDGLRVYDGAAVDDFSNDAVRNASVQVKYLSGTEMDFYGTFIDPDAVYTVTPSITIANIIPAAFTITEISIACDADPTTEITMTFNHKAAGVGYGTPTTIEAVTTTNGTATITSGIDDATIAAGVKMFITLSDPDDALLECAWQIEGDWD